jgi:rod shape-determining protein MreC
MHGRARSRSTGLFLTLSAAMLALAVVTQQSWALTARGAAKGLLAPLEGGMVVVANGISHASATVGDMARLRDENNRLTAENQSLRRQVAELSAAGTDNEALRQALNFERSFGHRLVAAQVINRGPDGFSRTVEIDRGTSDGVLTGMIVATGAGLMGRVREASQHAAIVQTLADPQSRVNVFLSTSGLQGTVVGGPDALQLQIEHRLGVIASNGEWAITSGIGGGYPRGLVVGEVASVSHRDSSSVDQAQLAWVNDPTSVAVVLVVTDFMPL